jgi:thiamine-monophosphate kinase
MLENKKTKLTPIENLGEFELINHLTKNFSIDNLSSKTGIGDDGCVIDFKKNLGVISTEIGRASCRERVSCSV